MSTTIYNDYKPETRSLIHRLEEAGFAIVSANNGDDENLFLGGHEGLAINAFIDELTAADDAWLRISRDGFNFSLYLVYGNEPGVIVNDYRYNVNCHGDDTGAKALAALEDAVDAHYSQWENRKQPTRTV